MPYRKLTVGRKKGTPWMGLDERTEDSVQMPNKASGGYNFRVGRGVLETRPGITHATDVTPPTDYYATLGAAGRAKFPNIEAYDNVMNGMVRWTWVISFRTPTAFPAKGWLIHKGVTISATQYEQGVYFTSTGKVYVELCDSSGSSVAFDSGSSVLSAATNYVLIVARYDTDAYLYWSTTAVSPDVNTVKGTTTSLGELDHAHKSDDGTAHDIVFGAEYDLGTTTYSNYLTAGAELHEATLLQYYVDHVDFGYTSFADPLDPRCALSVRFEDASGNFTDLSTNGNDSDATNAITYQQTTNNFMSQSAVVQMLAGLTKSDGEERLVVIADGTMSVGTYHA